jgi:hypothetical protein
VTVVPALSDEQVDRIVAQLETFPNAFLLVRRISEHTLHVQGIPVRAPSAHEADALTWELLFTNVRAALGQPWDWDCRITAIDVRESDGALAM